MRYVSILSWCVALAPLLGGCGPGTTTVSCEVGGADAGASIAHTCTEYDNEPDNAVTDFDGSCMGVSGNGCSLTGVLGTCVIGSADYVTTVTERYYSFGSMTADDAHTACGNLGGTWSPGG